MQSNGNKKWRSCIRAATWKEWRNWLRKNHRRENAVWLIIFRKAGGIPSVNYIAAVEEALCFGWIDSKGVKRNAESYYQYFSRRNPGSNWSRVNKERVAALMAGKRMAKAGIEAVQLAQQNGNWTALNDVDNLVVPTDLQVAFNAQPMALENWIKFPASSRRGILEWISTARRPDTRARRIDKLVTLAAKNERVLF